MSILQSMVRAWRTWGGFCSACNSDAPAVYTCAKCRVGWRFQEHGNDCECVHCVPTILDEADGKVHPRGAQEPK